MASKRKKARGSGETEFVRPTAVDRHVGVRVKTRRKMLGLSQQKLAAGLGITWQQLQKNEKGVNRIAASRLFQLSGLLSVPIQWFFDDMPEDLAKRTGKKATVVTPVGTDEPAIWSSETAKLVRAYYKIVDPAVRAQVRGLARSLAADEA